MNGPDRGIDFAGIRADNPIAETVGRYLELKRQGGEYKARCPFHNDSNPSFAVVPAKGKAFCNACQWHGDVIDFVAAFENVDLAEAAKRLSGGQLPNERPPLPELPPDEADDWQPIVPAPEHAGQYDPARTYNPRRGREVNWKRAITRCDAYRAADGQVLGYVVRMDIDGAKLTPTVVWARHRDGREAWISGRFPNPRPLQGLDDLAKRPTAAVLVVSGEKCREAGARALPGFVVVTWAGGDGNVLKADWRPIYGRRVTIWPDADASGEEAAHKLAEALEGDATETRLVVPTDVPKGWDVADAVADGMDTAAIVAWVKPRLSVWNPIDPEPEPPLRAPPLPDLEPDYIPPEQDPDPGYEEVPRETEQTPAISGTVVDLPVKPSEISYVTQSWEQLGLELGNNGAPSPNLNNAVAILERHPNFTGLFWFDEFLGRVLTTWNAERVEREWSDADDIRLALTIQRVFRIGRMAVGTVRDAVTAVAMAHRRNECREWLESLCWDGTARLPELLAHGFGTPRNEYTEAVGRCWVVSMAARVVEPGCKVDTMPVFEGMQGRGKSTALQVLVGSRWFAEAAESPTSKDFFQALQGKMLVEIGEMDAFSRGEVTAVKRVISCASDRYRAPYGRRAEDHPRMCVFAGTTNKDDWNRDETGARRFWPVACGNIDLAWIAMNREQLFAEAMHRLRAREQWWDVPAEDALREQEARRDADEWEQVIGDWLIGRWEVTVGEVLSGALKMEADSWDKQSQMRAAKAIRALGWTKETAWRGGKAAKVWVAEPGGKGGKDFVI